MKLVPTRRTDYGIRALIFLAGANAGHSKAAVIAQAMDIPVGFLPQVLQELQRAQLVTSQSGPTGGYSLARSAETITIREIVEAMEGPIRSPHCALKGGPCHWEDVCALHWVWSAALEAMSSSLESATLAKVAADDRALAERTLTIPTDSHRKRP